MAWTDDRIDALRTMWEKGLTASQIAEDLGGVSRNAVIGKAHRLGLQARPSPVRTNEQIAAAAREAAAAAAAAAAPPASAPAAAATVVQPVEAVAVDEPEPEVDVPEAAEEAAATPEPVSRIPRTVSEARAAAVPPPSPYPPAIPSGPTGAQLRSVGPGGFLRQGPGDQAPPATPAPARRLVPARPSADVAGKTTLLDLSDKVCKWPLGHPGEPDFHFCGQAVNPGFPYCVQHCGQAYQAQMPRRDRRGPPPLPFGGPRVR